MVIIIPTITFFNIKIPLFSWKFSNIQFVLFSFLGKINLFRKKFGRFYFMCVKSMNSMFQSFLVNYRLVTKLRTQSKFIAEPMTG